MRSARADHRRRRHERVARVRRRRRLVARGVRQPALLPLPHGADADQQRDDGQRDDDPDRDAHAELAEPALRRPVRA